jgi:hypothetical protein
MSTKAQLLLKQERYTRNTAPTDFDLFWWVHSRNTRPPQMRKSEKPITVTKCTAIRRVVLEKGCVGLVLPTPRTCDYKLSSLFNDALQVFDPVPPGLMRCLFESISVSNVLLDHPRFDHFSEAVPLRPVEESRNYCYWDNDRLDWCIDQFDPEEVVIQSSTFMLIVKERPQQRRGVKKTTKPTVV